jgi:collagen type III alpha
MDSDGDGKISKDEVPERMRPMFDSMDSNGDGFIDSEEIKALQKKFGGGGRRPGGGGPGGPGGGSRPGPGT